MASVKKSKAETGRNYVALLRIYGLDKISPREQSRLRAWLLKIVTDLEVDAGSFAPVTRFRMFK